MIIFLRKTGIFVVRSVLMIAALLFLTLIALQIILVAGINLIAAGHGSSFFENQINKAIINSGYQITFNALYYDPVRGFSLRDLTVADKDGTFLTLDKLSLGANLARIPLREIDVYASGGNLNLQRLPASKAEEVEKTQNGLAPFAMPDIYFRVIDISNLSFDEIKLSEQIAGSEFIFSPSLHARAILNDHISLNLSFKPGMSDLAENVPAPEQIDLKGSLKPSTLDFTIGEFVVTANDYRADVQGHGNLADDGALDVTANAKHTALALLTGEALHSAEAKISIIGPLTSPALDLKAEIIPENLKQRGLSDIHIALQTADITDGMKGHARVETSFKDDPVTLESNLSYEAPRLTLSDLKGTAPKVTISGGGVLSTESKIFDGILDVIASDLSHYDELAGIKLGGKLKANAVFNGSDTQTQSLDLSVKIDNGIVDSFSVKALSAEALIDDLTNPWPKSAKVNASSLNLAPDVTINTINAAINDAGNEKYKLSLKGSGHVTTPISFDGSAMLSNLTQGTPNADDINFNVGHGGSSLNLSGLFHADNMDLKLVAKDFRGKDIPADLPKQFEGMRINLNAAMTGAPSKPVTDVRILLNGLGAGAYQNASITAKAQHDGQNVTAQVNGNGTGIRKLDGTTEFPLNLSIMPFAFTLDKEAPLKGSIIADIDLGTLSPLFLPPTQNLIGGLNANGTITGTLSAPAPAANIRLVNAKFQDDANGIEVADINANADITKEKLTLLSLSATDGKEGKINGGGSLSFAGQAANIKLGITNFNAPRSTLADGVWSADLSLQGSAENSMELNGGINVSQLNVMIPEKFSSSIPQLNIVEDEKENGPSFLDRLALDIKIEAHNQVFVRGWGLDAEFGGDVAVSGTASAPQMNGILESRRGRFEEFGKRFTLARANLRFQGDVPPSPYLDIEATTPAGDVTGSILMTGPVAKPSIKFASTPALPEDEVLSRILFGRDSARITPFQAVQLAQTIRRFSGEGGGGPGLDPLGMLRSATGLDDISVDTDETGAASVGVGKYLTDNVYLELGKGKAENSGEATIKIEVTPSINVESRIGQDAQGGGGVFWKHDY